MVEGRVSGLWALLPTAQAAAIDTMLGEALLSKPSDDTRTSEQFMADEFCHRLLTNAEGEAAIKTTIAPTIPATSLAGLSDEPGISLDGPTGGQNMWSLCRRHHRMTTAGVVTATLDQQGQPIWHPPSGRDVAAEHVVLTQLGVATAQ